MGNRFKVRIPPVVDPGGTAAAAAHVKEIGETEYDAEVGGALPIVLDFYSKESKACDALAPRFSAVAERFAGKVRFLRIVRETNTVLAAKLGVTASPTLVFFVAGKEAAQRMTGDEIKRTELKARVEAMLGLVSPSAQ